MAGLFAHKRHGRAICTQESRLEKRLSFDALYIYPQEETQFQIRVVPLLFLDVCVCLRVWVFVCVCVCVCVGVYVCVRACT